MSSHHFVKEGQEPPLVVLDWNVNLAAIASELLAWQPQLIVKDSLVNQLVHEGLKPDQIIGKNSSDFDFLYPVEFIEPNIDLFQAYPKSSFLVDLDQTEAITLVKKYSSIIYTSTFRIFSVTSSVFEKWMPVDKKLFYFDNETGHIIEAVKNENEIFSLTFTSETTIILEEL